MVAKTATLKTASPKTPVPKAPRAKSAASRPQDATIVETAQEARGGEPGPSVLALLTVSTIAAIFVLSIVWFMFFRATT